MSDKHRSTLEVNPTKRGISRAAAQKKPVVPPFRVKWPDACQLHQVMSYHNQNDQPAKACAIEPRTENNNTHIVAFMVTAFNIAAFTILGWCLFEKIVSGVLFIGMEIMLLISTCCTLWWSAGVTGRILVQEEAETEDIFDEDDFIIH